MTVCTEKLSDLKIPEYKKAVEALFDEKFNGLIPNSSAQHAIVVDEAILNRTPKDGDFYLLCHNLSKECFNNPSVLAAAKEAAKNGVKFHIAHAEDIDSEKFKDEVFKTADFTKIKPLIVDGKEINFVTNGTAVRIEWDASIPHADVIPYAPVAAHKLIDVFNKLVLMQKKLNVW